MRGRAGLLAAGPLLLIAGCILAALTTRSWPLELAENEPVYLPQLDAALTVSDYRISCHPGTTAPRGHSCRLAFAAATETTRATVAVNRPVSFAGHRLHLTGHRVEPDPYRFVVRFVLRRFPAWPFVLAGIIATVAGAFGLAALALVRAPGPAGEPPPARGRRVRLAALPVLVLAGALVVTRTIATGHLPFAGMFEALLFWSLGVALFQLSPRDAGIPGLAVAAGLLAVVFLLPGRLTAPRPLAPALISPWFTPHIAAAFLGYGGLTAAVLSPRRGLGLPVGFALFTLAIAFGMVWAEQAWAAFWSWDPKETWSLVTWLLMAAALVLRRLGRRRAERAATALAFATVLYNFLVVNLVLRGMHSYQ
jgi:ABC-type transport system involved in cytochrome c biogenesis permease subunit